MEFPELGVHCAEPSCSRLDFLPFTCDACHKVFCLDHKTYDQHCCTESYSKDAQVPVCPLCGSPVPIKRGEDPNIKVDQHILNDCRSEAAKKLYVNRCSFKGCKKKELVQVNCNTCRKTFCLKHRFETDHNCEGVPNRLKGVTTAKPQSTTLSAIGAQLNSERLKRQGQRHVQQSSPHSTNMGEDEAMARAIAASLSHSTPPSSVSHSPEQAPVVMGDDDEALAHAIAASLQDSQPRTAPKKTGKREQSSDACAIS